MTQKERIEIGVEAKKLTENKVFIHAIEKAKAMHIANITKSQYNEQDVREHAYVMLSAIDDIHNVLNQFIKDGKAAELESDKQPLPRLKPLR